MLVGWLDDGEDMHCYVVKIIIDGADIGGTSSGSVLT